MCTPKDVLDPSVDGQISYLCGRHDCSLLHFGDPVIGTVYDDRILVSSGQWWPLPRVLAPPIRRTSIDIGHRRAPHGCEAIAYGRYCTACRRPRPAAAHDLRGRLALQ